MSESQMPVITERDVAALLCCSPAALRRMRREGRGPRWTRVGRLVRYPLRWVQDWIEANEGNTSVPTGTPGGKIVPNATETGGPDAN